MCKIKLNNNYIRKILITIKNNTTIYTISQLAKLITMTQDDYSSAIYTIITISNELIILESSVDKSNIDMGIKITGLTSKGSDLLSNIYDDAAWSAALDVERMFVGLPIDIMAMCCTEYSKLKM